MDSSVPAPAPAPYHVAESRTTPKDFFLWLGTILSLYGSVTAFLTLIFFYINFAYPDPLSYSYNDPYSSPMRAAMAALVVLVPTMLALRLIIRRDIVKIPGKADIWIRKWALVLTIFLAVLTGLIDLITLLTTYLGGDLSIRFTLKAIVVLLVAFGVTLHFLADLKGYWTLHRRKVNIVGAAVGALMIMTVVGGLMLIGSPAKARAARFDQQKVNDLSNIQYQVTYYWQRKQALPPTLETLNDPLQGYSVPSNPETGGSYEYRVVSPMTFELCTTFTASTNSTNGGNSAYASPNTNFMHEAGRTCFTRTIDPDKYPAIK